MTSGGYGYMPDSSYFLDLAHDRARRAGLGFTPGADRQLTQLIERAVTRDDFDVDQATESTKQLADTMVQEARRRGLPAIDERATETALRIRCPIPPFC